MLRRWDCPPLPPQRGSGWSLRQCEHDLADDLASIGWSAAWAVTSPGCELPEARAQRADIARDFRGIMSPALFVYGLEPIKRAYARRAFTYHDPQRANAPTLCVGSKAGQVRRYDQHAADADKGAPEGFLRFEVQANDGWLEAAGVRTAADLDAMACARIAEQRWQWSAMGTLVTGPVNAVQLLQRRVHAGDVS